MEASFHHFSDLFAQLGLPNEEQDMARFIHQHSGLAPDVRLADAPFWTPAQAALLKNEWLEDADWVEVIDQLELALRKPH